MKSINKRLGSLVKSTFLEHLLCIFCEHLKCSSCASLEHVLKIYSKREREYGGSHGCIKVSESLRS
jgi:hypothetical protein